MCVCLLFIARCMLPAAALADSGAFLHLLLHDQLLFLITLSYTRVSVPYSRNPPDKGGVIRRKKEKDKGKYILGRAWPVLLPLLPWGLLSVPTFAHSSPFG